MRASYISQPLPELRAPETSCRYADSTLWRDPLATHGATVAGVYFLSGGTSCSTCPRSSLDASAAVAGNSEAWRDAAAPPFS